MRFMLIVGVIALVLTGWSLASGEDDATDTESTIFRKIVSKTPEYASGKGKLDVMPVYIEARRADDDKDDTEEDDSPLEIEYYSEDGELLGTRSYAKPLISTYTDEVDTEDMRVARDIFVAVSRDDGNTWKRYNISRTADLSSFELATGEAYPGDCRNPAQKVIGNMIFVTWTSTYAKGGKPRYAIDVDDDYEYDDPYFVEDIWGVGGSQGSVDYDEVDDVADQGIGEIPYSCLWCARGVIVTKLDIDAETYGDAVEGDIIWFKPERLTSGRRDAYVQVVSGAKDAGFAIAWQEDPDGLRPGKGKGSGVGWSGAISNQTTDIWYSYILAKDFLTVDTNFVTGGDGQDAVDARADADGRLKALVPMSLPVRISDNDMINSENMGVELDGNDDFDLDTNGKFKPTGQGTRSYAFLAQESDLYAYANLDLASTDADRWVEFTNTQDDTKLVLVTGDGRVLDGDTSASRTNIALQAYKKPDGTKSAWVILAYEETKGLGESRAGLDEKVEAPDYGKNVIYHSFDIEQPDLVSAGDIVNLPALDDDGNRIEILDEDGNFLQYKTEVARRVRFLLQPKSKVGESGLVMLVIYKQGRVGQGRPADVMGIRVVSDDEDTGNPYKFSNFQRGSGDFELASERLHINLSSTTYLETWTNDDAGSAEDTVDGVTSPKVVTWGQTADNLKDESFDNPYSTAKGHRGFIRGDFIAVGFSHTSNWAATRNGRDNYDFYIRRSFDGGVTWTSNPDGEGTSQSIEYVDPDTGEKDTMDFASEAGAFEVMRNISNLPNAKETVLDPRIYGAPSTITHPDGTATGFNEDVQDPFTYVVTYGTGETVTSTGGDIDTPESEPLDLFYTRTIDGGDTYAEVEWEINSESDSEDAGETVYRIDWLAKGDPHQGEAQIRINPDGSRFYAVWHQSMAIDDLDDIGHFEGDDIWFRRVTYEFEAFAETDLNKDEVIDKDDLKLLLNSLNTTLSTSADRRDLNHDGKISGQDVKEWVKLVKKLARKGLFPEKSADELAEAAE